MSIWEKTGIKSHTLQQKDSFKKGTITQEKKTIKFSKIQVSYQHLYEVQLIYNRTVNCFRLVCNCLKEPCQIERDNSRFEINTLVKYFSIIKSIHCKEAMSKIY